MSELRNFYFICETYLTRSLQEIRDLQRHNANNGVVLSVPRVADSDGKNGGPPVADKPLSTRVKDGLG